MKEEIEHPGKKLVGRREVRNPDKQGWDGLMGWIQTNSSDNNGHVEIETDTGRLIIRDGHLYGYIKNRLVTVDGRSVQMMRTQHYLPSAGLNEFDPITGTWRY